MDTTSSFNLLLLTNKLYAELYLHYPQVLLVIEQVNLEQQAAPLAFEPHDALAPAQQVPFAEQLCSWQQTLPFPAR